MNIILAHLAGDYLFQTKYMALHKADKDLRGLATCVLHCLIYTTSVAVVTWTWNPITLALVLFPHLLIDRFSLANVWLKTIRGRTFESAEGNTTEYKHWDVAFTALVYTVVDNTMHLFCLWFVIS